MSGSVGVYQRSDGRIYVASDSRVSGGLYIMNGWVGAVAADASDAELGLLVIDGLDHIELDISDVSREDMKKLLRPLLQLAGVSSYTRLAEGTRCVGIERDVAKTLTLMPAENRGKRGEFAFLPDSIGLRQPFDDAEVGRATRKALSLARIRM